MLQNSVILKSGSYMNIQVRYKYDLEKEYYWSIIKYLKL